MLPVLARRVGILALVVGAAFATGCGSDGGAAAGKTIVKGKLVKGGNPYALDQSKVKLPKGGTGLPPGVSGESVLQVVFISTEGKEQFQAKTNPDAGTFEVEGTDGKGIPPGRYKIAITARVGFSPGDPDLFDGKFSPEKTQILRDIKPGDEVVIDIDKPQG